MIAKMKNHMAISLYYTAKGPWEITQQELLACTKIINRYNTQYPYGELYEHFGIDELKKFSPTHNDDIIILNGSTKLPSDILDMNCFREIINWWLKCLSEIAKVLPDAQWNVHINDIPII